MSQSINQRIIIIAGPNGAGKTSTIKVLATLLRPSAGRVRVCGHDVVTNPGEVRRKIGYLPDFFGVYDDLSAEEYLHFFAAAYHIPSMKRRGIISDVLSLTDLTAKAQAHPPYEGWGYGEKLRVRDLTDAVCGMPTAALVER